MRSLNFRIMERYRLYHWSGSISSTFYWSIHEVTLEAKLTFFGESYQLSIKLLLPSPPSIKCPPASQNLVSMAQCSTKWQNIAITIVYVRVILQRLTMRLPNFLQILEHCAWPSSLMDRFPIVKSKTWKHLGFLSGRRNREDKF